MWRLGCWTYSNWSSSPLPRSPWPPAPGQKWAPSVPPWLWTEVLKRALTFPHSWQPFPPGTHLTASSQTGSSSVRVSPQ